MQGVVIFASGVTGSKSIHYSAFGHTPQALYPLYVIAYSQEALVDLEMFLM